MVNLVLLLIPLGFVIAWPVTWYLVRFGLHAEAFDSAGSKGHHKESIRRVPNIGGIAIFLGVALPIIAGLLVIRLIPDSTLTDIASSSIIAQLPGLRERSGMALILLGCLIILHIMGVIDDRRPLRPDVKLIIQALVALVMIMYPFDSVNESRLLSLLDGVPILSAIAPWPSVCVTLLWFLAVTNAINMMDNMDGLAGGVSCIAACLFLAAVLIGGQWFIAGLLALLIGSLLAFLWFNRPPARIFMGDGGSLIIGFLLAFLTVRTTYVDTSVTATAAAAVVGAGSASATTAPTDLLTGHWYGIFMPLIVLAVPLYDLVTVVTIRLAQGKNPMVGDQQHFSHRLIKRGLSHWQMLGVVYGLTIATGLGGVSLGQLRAGWEAALVGVQVIIMLAVLALYERGAHRQW